MTYTQLNALPDETLMEHLTQGNGDALAVLFRRYQRLVFSVAMKVLRHLGEAEDVTQTVFMEIFRQAAAYNSAKGSTKIWVLKIAYHHSLNRRRHLNARSFYTAQEITAIEDLLPLLDPMGMNYSEKKRLIEQALAKLNPTHRTVLELAFFEGLSMAEIAERTGNSVMNVRHYYYRSIDRLRSELVSASRSGAKLVRKEVSGAEA